MVIQKLFKQFNGTFFLADLVLKLSSVLPVISVLNSNDLESVIGSLDSSL